MTDWSKLKVTELKEEFKSRGIPLTGLKLKADFVTKLEELDTTTAAAVNEEDAEVIAPDDGPSEREPEVPATEAHDEPAVIKNGAPEENLHNRKLEEDASDDSPESQAVNATLPEDVDMYSASQLKPTPSQSLTEILRAKEKAKSESQYQTKSPTAVGNTSDVGSPVLATEQVEDSKKRKRKDVTPPPSTQDVALKKAKAGDGAPIITKQESSLEQMQAATDAAEAIQAPDGLGHDVHIQADALGPRGDADNKPFQSTEISTGNEQTALRSPSPKRQAETARIPSNRNVPPASHPATRSLYLRGFKRPLHVSLLRDHLIDIAGSPSNPSAENTITAFHLDNIRTHALVSCDSITTAARVRSAMHQTVFPDEASRIPIWVDFIPDDQVESWIAKETSSSDRNKKWEVVYSGTDNVTAVHQEVDATGPPRRPSAAQSRHVSMSEALSRPPGPTIAGVHPDRANQVPEEKRDSYDRGLPSRPEPKAVVVPTGDLGTGFKALDELFSSTTTKPKLYYKAVSASVAEDRLELIKDLQVPHSEMGESGDEGMKRYSFEIYKGKAEWVEKGPEFGYGRRGVEILSGRRGRGGGYRGGRGDNRGRGGDSWRGRY
jgi:hypothetical protein